MNFDNAYADHKSWADCFCHNELDAAYFCGEFSGLDLAGLRVLELGFGEGRFLSWATEQGAQCTGCELIPWLVAQGHQRGYDVREGRVEDAIDFRTERFDLIVAFDVLEHVPLEDLLPMMNVLKSLLSERGQMLFRVPNGESPFGRFSQHGDLTHVSILSKGRFAHLAQQVGLSVLRCSNAYRVVDPEAGWWGRRDGVRYWVRDRIEQLIGFAYGFTSRPMDPNVVVVMAVPTPGRHAKG